MNPTRGGWVVLLSLLVAMVFAVFHLPESWPSWLGVLRPNWILLVLFFWVMEIPHRIGLFIAYLMGLVVDALLAEPLGLNGIIFAGFTFITWSFFERLRMYSVLQQAAVVFALVAAAELVRMGVLSLDSVQGSSWLWLATALVTALLWPLVYLLLLRIRTLVRVE